MNIEDDFNRKTINIEAGFSFHESKVINILEHAILEHVKPQKNRIDNEPEFISSELEAWCNDHHIELQFFQPAK